MLILQIKQILDNVIINLVQRERTSMRSDWSCNNNIFYNFNFQI